MNWLSLTVLQSPSNYNFKHWLYGRSTITATLLRVSWRWGWVVRTDLKCRCVSGGRSRSKTPAPLKGLEGFLEVEEHEMRFESWRFLGHYSSFAFLGGKSIVVDFWVRPLELKRWGHASLLSSTCTPNTVCMGITSSPLYSPNTLKYIQAHS